MESPGIQTKEPTTVAISTWPIIVYRKGKGDLTLGYFCKPTALDEDEVK